MDIEPARGGFSIHVASTGAHRAFLDGIIVEATNPKTAAFFLAFVPQWDFLTFVTHQAARYPGFRLVMQAEVEDLIVEGGSVRGVRYTTPDGPHEVRALLTVGAGDLRAS